MGEYSTLLNGQLYFGQYPSLIQLNQLRILGVNICIDLTQTNDYQYIDKIHFPIRNKGVPSSKIAFHNLVTSLCNHIRDGKKIYIHCRHGRGRTGLLVAALIGHCLKVDVNAAMHIVSAAYQTGNATEKSPKRLPHHHNQQNFLKEYFRDYLK